MIGRAVEVRPPFRGGMFDSTPAYVVVESERGTRHYVVCDSRCAADIAEALADGESPEVEYETWQVRAVGASR